MAENKFNFNVKKPKPGKVIFLVIIAIIAVVVIIGLFSSFYTVDETELGILTLFGKVIDGNVTSGLKFKLPFVDEVEIVDVSSKKAEFGFRTADASLERTTYIKGEKEEQVSRMLTGDLNISDVEWVVQYYVHDPYKYVFEIENADDGGTSTVFGDYAWYDDNSGSSTHDVGTKLSNHLGIYDMSGNVW